MQIQRYPLGQMQANCYFVIDDKKLLIIDPADSADFILEEVSRRNLELVGLVATHGHFDHIMAVGEIQLAFAHDVGTDFLPLYIHPKDQFLVKRLGATAKHFLGFDPGVIQPHLFKELHTGSDKIGPFTFQVVETPGHTPGGCCLFFENENALFTGDTIFRDGIGRYDFAYSDKNKLKSSIDRILEFDDAVTIYPGHGEEALIEEVRENREVFF